MNIRQLSCGILVSSLAAIAGYYSGALRQDTASFLSVQAKLAVDDLYAPQSFSEVENAKALLAALSEEFLGGINAQRATNYAKAVIVSRTGKPLVETHLREVIKQLERGVVEFKGTEQELDLVEPLLAVLKKEGLYDQWTAVYLNALYQHPMHAMIGRLATAAVIVSKAAGCQNAVLDGFEFVSGIPMEFDVKARIKTALVHARIQGLVPAR